MQKFIGVVITKTKPMTRAKYNEVRGWDLPDDEDGTDQGYYCTSAAGHTNWMPKEVFDIGNTPIAGKDNTISQADVDSMIGSINTNTIKIGKEPKSTLVTVVLINGFVMHETSSCVDPANYDEKVGAEICMKKIKDKIWYLLSFLLQSGVNGFKAVK